jgi:hypothetical protein
VITTVTPFAGEREFAGQAVSGFGAADALPGICHPHVPRPLATIRRLQTALRGLAQRVKDPSAGTPVDGLVGPHTVRAVNYAVPKYTSAPGLLSTGTLTHAQIVSFAPQLAAYAEKSPTTGSDALLTPAFMTQQSPAAGSGLPAAPKPAYTAPSGGSSMPYPAAQYYPPGYAPAPSYPGYAPRPAPRQANVDTKVYIPAQYEHISFNPATVALVLAVGVGTVLVMNKSKQYKKIA